jgi:hypothetical protein
MPCPPHSSRFYHPNNNGRGVQVIQQLITCLFIYIYKVNMYWSVLLRLLDRNFIEGFRNDAYEQTWRT